MRKIITALVTPEKEMITKMKHKRTEAWKDFRFRETAVDRTRKILMQCYVNTLNLLGMKWRT